MIKKVLVCIVGLAVFAAAAATAVVAAAFALYAILAPQIGVAGAAASVAGAAALLAALIGLIAMVKAGGRFAPRPKPEPTLMERVTDFARERPGIAIAGALAAGIVAIKNPKLAAGLASAFMAGKAADKASDKSRRRW